MSLHADVAVPGRDRKRLERLCRYVARPPIAIDRLEALPDGRLAYRLKTRWRDGTTHVLMERHELLERLAPLIPPPRAHQVRYHGLLAPCASGRDRVVPKLSPSSGTEARGPEARGRDRPRPLDDASRGDGSNAFALGGQEASRGALDSPVPRPSDLGAAATAATSHAAAAATARSDEQPSIKPTRRYSWADLLQRVFEVDALYCSRCGGRMRVLAAITEAEVAQRILACLALPTRAPPLAASRTGDLAKPWPDPEEPSAAATDLLWSGFDFDQSAPPEWDVGA